jgi:hypothetical protein
MLSTKRPFSAMDNKNDETGASCPCKWVKCPRHGDCGACREHHEKEKKFPPFCEKNPRRKKGAAKSSKKV